MKEKEKWGHTENKQKKTGHQITDNPLNPHTTTINTLVDEIHFYSCRDYYYFLKLDVCAIIWKPDFLVDWIALRWFLFASRFHSQIPLLDTFTLWYCVPTNKSHFISHTEGETVLLKRGQVIHSQP